MDGLLRCTDQKQLSEWIGRECHFRLLYKITRDGGSSEKFHELCDNKGPTVTIFYNTGSNVYGGYLSERWSCSGVWATDQNAFLFKLYTAANWMPKIFHYIKGKGNNYYKDLKCGPCFQNLLSFENSVVFNKTRSCFPLKTSNLLNGSHFDMGEETGFSVANGHNNVTDLEVYLVKDGPFVEEAWRESPEWNLQACQELKENIIRHEPFEEANVPESNILLVGQVDAGKSSFLNTINSIFKGKISSRSCSGSTENSLTKSFGKFHIRDPTSKKRLKFSICDTRGIEVELSIKDEDIGFTLDGNLPNHYTFNPFEKASTKVPGFVKDPTLKDRMHVVVFVIDGSTLDVLPEIIIKKLKYIKALAEDRGIPQLVFLTKMDKICEHVKKDISNMFTSEIVEGAVNKAANIIAIPRSHVFPVKNYEKKTKLHTNLDIVALGALYQALVFADDFLENQCDVKQGGTGELNTKD
ncbi:interferon-induced protein 44-like [Saccostrea cucullata]|uniref:interferon-induced protein 44-like n=1 Tax=Saccostrea cuccullata TaxID=36930 RepID=UPI002ED5B9A6